MRKKILEIQLQLYQDTELEGALTAVNGDVV
jgi:hypothetical protein